MDSDLQTDPPRDDWYEWALSSFYVTYILFEWMSLLWRVFPAHIYVSCLVLSWGIVSSLQALATSYPMLVALRALLGIGEAGFTGVPFYLSFFFKRGELAYRTAIFISGEPSSYSAKPPPFPMREGLVMPKVHANRTQPPPSHPPSHRPSPISSSA